MHNEPILLKEGRGIKKTQPFVQRKSFRGAELYRTHRRISIDIILHVTQITDVISI